MLELTEEEELIKHFVGDLADKHGRSYWLACSREGKFTEELWAELASGGYLGMLVTQEYGGAGLGMKEMTVLLEEMGNQGVPHTSQWSRTRLLRHHRADGWLERLSHRDAGPKGRRLLPPERPEGIHNRRRRG